jgi:hypothetical protein
LDEQERVDSMRDPKASQRTSQDKMGRVDLVAWWISENKETIRVVKNTYFRETTDNQESDFD